MKQDETEKRRFIGSAAEIDADWMTAALRRNFPGVRVLALAQGDVILGAQTKIRIRLTMDERGQAAGIPEHVVVKADIEEFGRGPVANVVFNEPRAYRDIVPSLGVEAPRIWAAEPGDDGPAFTVMEDLVASEARFLYLGDPIGYDLASAYLDRMARIHARWWNAPELGDDGAFGALRKPVVGMFENYVLTLLGPERFSHFASLPRAAATPRALRDPDRLRAGLFRLRELHKEMPVCIVHGDTHLNNLYVTACGEPAFLDWSPRRTAWTQDVAYFLPAALDVPDRRRWEQELLRRYLAALGSHGVVAPSFQEAWLAYRRELVWGMFVFLINGPTQTEYSNTAAASRFAAAMLDHDTNRLLGVG
jgi:hypothetical protein